MICNKKEYLYQFLRVEMCHSILKYFPANGVVQWSEWWFIFKLWFSLQDLATVWSLSQAWLASITMASYHGLSIICIPPSLGTCPGPLVGTGGIPLLVQVIPAAQIQPCYVTVPQIIGQMLTTSQLSLLSTVPLCHASCLALWPIHSTTPLMAK